MSIDFAKLALILGYADREKILDIIKEEVILQECGLNKRLVHILYERSILEKEQIQSLLWGLFCKRRIKLFPSRVVYCFNNEDDELFLQKVGISFQQLIENVRAKKRFNLNKVDTAFPVKDLVAATNIHRKLQDNGIERSLLSVLSSRGSLKSEYRDLVDNIEERRVSLSSPIDVQNKVSTQIWSGQLFLRLLSLDKSEDQKQELQIYFDKWKELVQKIPIRFSELLLNEELYTEEELLRAGVALHTLTNVDQVPRTYFFHLKSSHKDVINSFLEKEKDSSLEELCKLHSKLPLEQIALYGNKELQQLVFPNKKSIDIYKKWKKQQRKKITKSFIPFSVKALDQDLQKQYSIQRQIFKKLPVKNMDNFVAEWSQTQILPFSPTENIAIDNENPVITPARVKDHTEYISLERPNNALPLGGATGYLSIDATQEEIQLLSHKLEKSLVEKKPTKTLSFLLFVASFVLGSTLYSTKFSDMYGLVFVVPFLVFTIWGGKRLDIAKGKWSFISAVYVFVISSYLLSTEWNYTWVFFQSIGYVYLCLSVWYCLYRFVSVARRRGVVVTTAFLQLFGFASSYYLQKMYINEHLDYLYASYLLLCLCTLSLFSISIPKLSYEDEVVKEKIIWNTSLITPFLFSFYYVVLSKFLTTTLSEVTFFSSLDKLYTVFISGILSGAFVAFICKRSEISWLRYISFCLVLTFVLSPFVITSDVFDSTMFVCALLCGMLLPIGISLLLQNSEVITGESIGYLLLMIVLGGFLGHNITKVLFSDIVKFFLVLSLVAIIHFYTMLVTPNKEIQHMEETRLGGLLQFLG
ncbi:hypothetical protein [Candidatus Uabimicrobium sp. HlEnr_7]|uniref:hypothetical protein n=1 Tax=Candidatus Uabimicrobium helgolandensis TaxID=3095367 RepID=UPI00355706B4